MDGGDSASAVNQKRGGQRIHTAVPRPYLFIAHQDAVIDPALLDVGLHHAPAIVVHGDSDHREAAVLVGLFELDEPGNLDFARPAPRGPEIEQDHFALVIRELDSGSVGVFEGEIWRDLAVLLGLHRRNGAGGYGRAASAEAGQESGTGQKYR